MSHVVRYVLDLMMLLLIVMNFILTLTNGIIIVFFPAFCGRLVSLDVVGNSSVSFVNDVIHMYDLGLENHSISSISNTISDPIYNRKFTFKIH